jgi:tetratricopeptide (TPR) repeat protein
MTDGGDDRDDRWAEAHEYLITGYYPQARRALEELRAEASGSWSAAEEMVYHARVAGVALRMGRYEEMLEQAENGLSLARSALPHLTVELLAWAALAHTMRGNARKAQEFLDRGLSLVSSLGHDAASSRARAILYRSVSNLRATEGRLREAVETAETSLHACEECDDAWETSIARYNVGEAYALLGQHATAMRFLDAAERDKISLGDKWGLAYVRRSKLRIFLDRGQIDEALEAVEEGLSIAREIEDPKLLSMIEVEYGRLLQRSGDFKTAASLAEAALHRAGQCGARSEEIAAIVLAGHISLARGENEGAVELADLALRKAEDAQLYRELAASQRLAALALARCGRIDDARAALDFMMPLVKALGNPYRRLELEIARVEVDAAAGQPRDGLLARLDKLTNRGLAIQAGWLATVIDELREQIAGC